MQHFFVEPSQIQGEKITIYGPDVKHMKQVLRMKEGEAYSVSNGTDGKEYICRIEAFLEDAILGNVEKVLESSRELPVRIHLFQGLPKSDKMELIIQKAVELGAYEIIPMKTARCIMKVEDSKEKKKLERWNGISEAAAKQSKRGIIPRVTGVLSYGEALAKASQMDIKMIPYEDEKGISHTREVIEGIKSGQDVAILIGPEGGFEEAEVEKAKEYGIVPVTLGKRILRTETAGFTAISWVAYHAEQD